MANPILMGRAEVIDLVLPQVRKMLAEDGVYLCRDTANPEYTIPLSVQGGVVRSMKLDAKLAPERFVPTVEFHGPYFGDPDAGEHGRLLRDAEELANALRDVLAGHPVLNADELIARYSPLPKKAIE